MDPLQLNLVSRFMPYQPSPRSGRGMWGFGGVRRGVLAVLFLGLGMPLHPVLFAQQAASSSTLVPVSQRGTVKAISGSTLTLTPDVGSQISATVSETTRLVQIAPGSTDLKSAQPIQLTDISVGDRVLITGRPEGGFDRLAASRVILMKSGDIAQRRAAEQADWQRRGSGGIVTAVDASAGTIALSSGQRKVEVGTSGTTVFRHYAEGSVRFEDAQPGTLAQIQPGDQVRVRGAKSADGSSILAEEIVSGSFRNVSGTVASVDVAGTSVTVKDLATKKNVVVRVTANTEVRKLPAEMATRFAARSLPSQGGAEGSAAGRGTPEGSVASRTPEARPAGGTGPAVAGDRTGSGPGGQRGPGGETGRGGGMDLSQMIGRLPAATLAELKPGDAVMVVGSQSQSGGGTLTAITMLSGVEPILAASPSGAPAVTLSPWSVGAGAPEGGGGGGQ